MPTDQVKHLINATAASHALLLGSINAVATGRGNSDAEEPIDLWPVKNLDGQRVGARGGLESLNESPPGEPARSSLVHASRHNDEADLTLATVCLCMSKAFEQAPQSRSKPCYRRGPKVRHENGLLRACACRIGELGKRRKGKPQEPYAE